MKCAVCKKEIKKEEGYIVVGDVDELTGEPLEGALAFHPLCYAKRFNLPFLEKRE